MAAAIGYVGWSTYRSWNDGPWIAVAPAKAAPVTAEPVKPTVTAPKAPFNTDIIVSKNLFDPERGAGATREAEENSRSFQRIRNLILVGTVVIGNNRVAILQDGSNPVPGQAVPAPAAPMRLQLGDNVEGYRLAEIADKRVVFAKDAARVELLLDYFRKVDVAAPRSAPAGQIVAPPGGAPAPRVVPNLPRRGRLPIPGSVGPQS